MPKDLTIFVVFMAVTIAVLAIVTRTRLPGGGSVSAKQWKLLFAEYERLELEYNLAAQAAGTPQWWVDPAVKYGADDPMMQLAARNIHGGAARYSRGGDLAVGFFTGYSTGRWGSDWHLITPRGSLTPTGSTQEWAIREGGGRDGRREGGRPGHG